MTGDVELRRPLGVSEEATWLMDRGAPLNFVIVARVAGPLGTDVLRAALDALQARHPQLRARVVGEAATGWAFSPDGVGPIPLEVLDAPPSAWRAQAEDDLPRRFHDQGPLLRARWLRHGTPAGADGHEAGGDGTLLLGMHHVIGDGRSAFPLVRDVLQAAGQLLTGGRAALPPLADVTPFDERLPAACHGPRAWLRCVRFLLRSVWRDRRWGPPVRVRRDDPAGAHERRTRVLPMELPADELDVLLDRCRREGTSLHGALAAAMILAVLDDRRGPGGGPAPREHVAFGTPVDRADRLEPPPGEALGLHVFALAYDARVSADTPFWDLARHVKAELERGLARGEDGAIARLTPALVRWMDARRIAPREFLERWERQAHATSGLTNVGRLSLPERHGPLRLVDCQAVSTPAALGDVLALAMTFAGRLHWNLLWPDPGLTAEHAEALGADMLARVRSAGGLDGGGR